MDGYRQAQVLALVALRPPAWPVSSVGVETHSPTGHSDSRQDGSTIAACILDSV